MGLTATWLNFRGAFAVWQQSRHLRWPIGAGLLLFGLSLCLPAAGGFSGWYAMWFGLERQVNPPIVEDYFDLESSEVMRIYGYHAQWTLYNVANLLAMASPLWAWRMRCGGGQVYMACFGCAAVSAWTHAVVVMETIIPVREGYYVWSLAQLCILSAARPRLRTLIAIFIMAPIRVFLWPGG